jgi:pseudouridine-5'-phosphate glycosidase
LGALQIAPEIAQALEEETPIVALESALITHGFSPPANLDIAQQMEAAIRAEGALPATIAILDSQARLGLSAGELERLADDRSARKVSLRDLPLVLAQGADGGVSGGTTVAATMALAHRARIRVFCTGGIGGVHRGRPEDVSADLIALASTPIITVCAGAKAILDLPRTLEMLETYGVPVIGYGADEFPAFYSRRSGLGVDTRVETPQEVAQIAHARTALGLPAALLVCVPIPEADELPAQEAETAIAQAVAEAEEKGIGGKAVTPFLLARMVELTGGRARRANEVLLLNNARTAARIARASA